MKNTTRKSLSLAAAKATRHSYAKCRRALDAMFDVMSDSLASGDTVRLNGVVSLQVKERKPRPARNPRTGEAVHLPIRKTAVGVFGVMKKKVEKTACADAAIEVDSTHARP